LIGGAAAILACILQVKGLIRYLGRLPEDCIGIVIYTVTFVAFAPAAIGFFIRWNKEKVAE